MTKETSNGSIDFKNPKVVEALKKTVAVGATDEEFLMFAELCKSTGLNPLKREIWFIKANGRPQMMTGINGYLAIANRHPQFDGMEVEFETTVDGTPTKAICKVYRKDRRFPSTGIALMKEFKGRSPIWQEKPTIMLSKVAKSLALREAFPQEMNGLYTEEEMPAEFSSIASGVAAVDALEKRLNEAMVTKYQAKLEATNRAIAEGREYAYAIPKDVSPAEKRVLRTAIKEAGGRIHGDVIVCAEEIRELSKYLDHAPDRNGQKRDPSPDGQRAA